MPAFSRPPRPVHQPPTRVDRTAGGRGSERRGSGGRLGGGGFGTVPADRGPDRSSRRTRQSVSSPPAIGTTANATPGDLDPDRRGGEPDERERDEVTTAVDRPVERHDPTVGLDRRGALHERAGRHDEERRDATPDADADERDRGHRGADVQRRRDAGRRRGDRRDPDARDALTEPRHDQRRDEQSHAERRLQQRRASWAMPWSTSRT